MNKIETVSLDRLRESHEIPSIGDDLLLFEEIQMLPFNTILLVMPPNSLIIQATLHYYILLAKT